MLKSGMACQKQLQFKKPFAKYLVLWEYTMNSKQAFPSAFYWDKA